ncbi:hypothetical protein FE257_005565 [Aspergillus nanangensis]|uniref:Uncharacterized protein n=1 Tax=Aspergillus nanangensis TaxID=2582783 RepID=A0AAD4GUJ6_ASPNN|nr:hypothetical protein FE257_005565 [Aspergillus nanangensis]
MRRSQFQAFFGYLDDSAAHSQAAESPLDDLDHALASNRAGPPDYTIPDQDTHEDLTRSPSITDFLRDIRSPSSWSNTFTEIRPFRLEPFQIPAWNMRVAVEILGKEKKAFLLGQVQAASNEDVSQGNSKIESFLNKLESTFVFYVAEDRTIRREQIHDWHKNYPTQTLTAKLNQRLLQESTVIKENSSKRLIRELSGPNLDTKLTEIATWVDNQADGVWIVKEEY